MIDVGDDGDVADGIDALLHTDTLLHLFRGGGGWPDRERGSIIDDTGRTRKGQASVGGVKQ